VGIEIDRVRFDESDYVEFAERLEHDLAALQLLLSRSGFGQQPRSLGAELELFLVDGRGMPVRRNTEILAGIRDSRVTVELDRFNLELNPRPSPLSGRPFEAMSDELRGLLTVVAEVAAAHSARVVMIGILPTLFRHHLDRGVMTDLPRYRALDHSLQRLRRQPFRICIQGRERLEMTTPHVAMEGANTAFQVHLRIAPEQFTSTFNAVQLATAPVLAAAGNSPTLLGRWLWEETRIALFEQSVDDRPNEEITRRPPRVDFGTQWVRGGPLELFEESVRLHQPLLPILSDEDPLDCIARQQPPRLDELRLHQSTVWRWNRAIYDSADGGHLRIEMRALPAGPTLVDMLANAAFLVGLTLALAPTSHVWVKTAPFEQVRNNFYHAARTGLGCLLAWPDDHGNMVVQPGAELVLRLLSRAAEGLREAGVAAEDIALLDVIDQRVRSAQTGACWQWRAFQALEPEVGRDQAFALVLERYRELAETGQPVHTWPL
jgi:gamma-glutamyl:cysteine ligase YbdK (ATP-grasp superfamily)